MKTRISQFGTAAVVAIAAFYLVNWYTEYSKREAYIARCNQEGAGGMFTSREYCEEIYARSTARH